MNITIIGYGNMGSGLATLASKSGHQVTITGRNLDKAMKVAEKIGNNVQVKPEGESTGNADIIIAATPYSQISEALKRVGNLDGKTVIDLSNPVKADMSGLEVGLTSSAAEEIAKSVTGAKLVKAFNTIFSGIFTEGTDFGQQKVQVFIAGDDVNAKTKVIEFSNSIGFEGFDAGPLANSRSLEPMAFLNIYLGYIAGKGSAIAPAWISRK
jgi:predicted dinucleotide-binding enzyme